MTTQTTTCPGAKCRDCIAAERTGEAHHWLVDPVRSGEAGAECSHCGASRRFTGATVDVKDLHRLYADKTQRAIARRALWGHGAE